MSANIKTNQPVTYVPNPNAADDATGMAPGYITYSGPPQGIPPDFQYIVLDIDGYQWQYYQGAWHL